MNPSAFRSAAVLALSSCVGLQSIFAAPSSTPSTPCSADTARAERSDLLLQHWVRSTEEEPAAGTVQVFRPAGSRSFPARRFRMAYTFVRGGACEYLFLSPDDAHRFKPCRWTLEGSDPRILRITADGGTTSLRVVELSTQACGSRRPKRKTSALAASPRPPRSARS